MVFAQTTKQLLTESEGYSVLERVGIPVPPHAIVKDAAAAADAAKRMGYPVVAKVVSPQVIHKSDAGGVMLGIENETGLRGAIERIRTTVPEKVKGAKITGFMVEKEMPKGLELIIGGRTDPTFGKVITFGLGGVLVELMRDVQIRVLPVTEEELERMVQGIKSYALIKGYRDEPPRDEKALMEVLRKICSLFLKDARIVEFDINPLILYEKGACAVDARFYRSEGVTGSVPTGRLPFSPKMFYPRSIAVVGASGDHHKVGYAVLRNLTNFRGKVFPVNPSRKEILGRKVYSSISAIKDKLDMIVVTVPNKVVPQILEDAGRKRVKLAVIISAGFREIGGEGEELEQEVLRIARKYGIRLIGPNCLGIQLPHQRINATFDPAGPRAGHIAFVSQSGAIITTVVDWSLKENVGFSSIISVGNQADMGFVEYLRFLEHDPETRSIILYIEQIKDGKAFMEVVKEVSLSKPVVAIKSGASKRGQKAASSHTGSLAGSYEVYMAAFRQCGVVQAETLEEAFQIGALLASEGYAEGPRAIIVSNAGGFAVLASDYAERYGIDVIDLPDKVLDSLNAFLTPEWSHENPMDLVGDAPATRYAQVFDVMKGFEEHWDVAFVISVPTTALDPRHLAGEIARFSRDTRKMIVGCMLGGDSVRSGVEALMESRIPNFSELSEAFRAVGKSSSSRPEGFVPGWKQRAAKAHGPGHA